MGVSKNIELLQVLQNILGEKLFNDVLNTFNGQRIVFPKDPELLNKDFRNSCIIKEYNNGEGVPVPDLMNKYQLSQSQIYKIIEKAL